MLITKAYIFSIKRDGMFSNHDTSEYQALEVMQSVYRIISIHNWRNIGELYIK